MLIWLYCYTCMITYIYIYIHISIRIGKQILVNDSIFQYPQDADPKRSNLMSNPGPTILLLTKKMVHYLFQPTNQKSPFFIHHL